MLVGLVVTAYLLPNPWRNTSAEAALLAAAGEVCVVAPPTPYDPKSGLGLHEAFYVSGSNALGPMRVGNLPAFASAAAARRFAGARGGVLLEAWQMSPQLLQDLSGERRHAHAGPPG